MTELNKIIAEQAKQGEKISSIEESCVEIKECLLGKTGLIIRTDRLEQKDKFKAMVFWLSLGLVATVAAKVISDILS